jgi:Pyruvate/2-oxoacid:ferredoxin oxidoreductase delta subunit
VCEFCMKHGEGKKWYLEAKNYSEDLLSDASRVKFIREFFKEIPTPGEMEKGLASLEKAPGFIRRAMTRRITRKYHKIHFGQVVPIEEIEQILGFVNSIIRVACICRYKTLGKEKRFCYGVSMGPNGGRLGEILQGIDKSFASGPHSWGAETVSKSEALEAMKGYEKEGLCHTVWVFQTPFIGGICNCDRSDCLALKTSVTHNLPMLFRAEYVAEIHPELCSGCRNCMRVCQFGALAYSAGTKTAFIDQRYCYGCGICRSVCAKEAISLRERAQVPAASRLWLAGSPI